MSRNFPTLQEKVGNASSRSVQDRVSSVSQREAQNVLRLRVNRVCLVQQLNVDPVVDYLRREGILSDTDVRFVSRGANRSEKTRMLLDMLPSKDPSTQWYNKFRTSLSATSTVDATTARNHQILVDFLDSTNLANLKSSSTDSMQHSEQQQQQPPLPPIQPQEDDPTSAEHRQRWKALRSAAKSRLSQLEANPSIRLSRLPEDLPEHLARTYEAWTANGGSGRSAAKHERRCLSRLRTADEFALQAAGSANPERLMLVCFISPLHRLLCDIRKRHLAYKYLLADAPSLGNAIATAFANLSTGPDGRRLFTDGGWSRYAATKLANLAGRLFDFLAGVNLFRECETVAGSLCDYLNRFGGDCVEALLPTYRASVRLMEARLNNADYQLADAASQAAQATAARINRLSFGQKVMDNQALLQAQIGRMLLDQGSLASALGAFGSAISTVDLNDTEAVFKILYHALQLYLTNSDEGKAEKLAVACVQHAYKFYKTESPEYIKSLLNFVKFSNAFCQDDFGVEVAVNASLFAQLILGYQHPLLAEVQSHLSLAHLLRLRHRSRRGQGAIAEPQEVVAHVEASLAAVRMSSGESASQHPNAASLMTNLAQAARLANPAMLPVELLQVAIEFGRKSVEIFSNTIGRHSPAAVQARICLGRLLADVPSGTAGNPKRAFALANDVIEQTECYGSYIRWLDQAYILAIELLSESKDSAEAAAAATTSDDMTARRQDWLSRHPMSRSAQGLDWAALHDRPDKEFFRRFRAWGDDRKELVRQVAAAAVAAAATTADGQGVEGSKTEFRTIISSYYRGCAGALLVFDASNRDSFDSCERWLQELRASAPESMSVVLVANKSDSDEAAVTQEEAAEFAKSHGVELCWGVSARTGQNVGQAFRGLQSRVLQSKVDGLSSNQAPMKSTDMRQLPQLVPKKSENSNEHIDYQMKVLLIGDSGVGKSSLLQRFADKEFYSTNEMPQTIGVEFRAVKDNIDGCRVKSVFWDTAGAERFRSITSAYYRGCAGALLIFDASNRDSFDSCERWLQELRANAPDSTAAVLVANKSDSDEAAVTQEEAYEFAKSHGVELCWGVSARTGQNVGQAFRGLQSRVLQSQSQQFGSTQTQQSNESAAFAPKAINASKSTKQSKESPISKPAAVGQANLNDDRSPDYVIKTVLIGDSGVGKSCLVRRFIDQEFDESLKAMPTIGVDFRVVNSDIDGSRVQTQIWDTAGQQRFRSITSAYYRGCAGALLIFDASNRDSFDSCERWLQELRASAPESTPVALVANKSDSDEAAVTQEEADVFAKSHGVELCWGVSARTGQNVGQAFRGLQSRCLAQMKLQKAETATKAANASIRIAEIDSMLASVKDMSSSNFDSKVLSRFTVDSQRQSAPPGASVEELPLIESQTASVPDRPAVLVNVIVVGNAGVGKSSLLARFVGGQFNESYAPTVAASLQSRLVKVDGVPVQCQIWDTAGQESHRSNSEGYYSGCQCAMLVYDVTDADSLRDCEAWLQRLRPAQDGDSVGLPADAPIALIGNKLDRRELPTPSGAQSGLALARRHGLVWREATALDSESASEAFLCLLRAVLQTMHSPEQLRDADSKKRKGEKNASRRKRKSKQKARNSGRDAAAKVSAVRFGGTATLTEFPGVGDNAATTQDDDNEAAWTSDSSLSSSSSAESAE
uniref:CARD domain-containing protein n=1 Tax=Macrostomum lignano TaxID=282301 RepID=A0A1I8FWW3_9PLAT